MIPKKCEKHNKSWGYELWIENNDKYCGKLLVFNKNAQFSMHYHMIKEETWYVSSGEFEYRWIDVTNAVINSVILNEGDVVHLKQGQPHQLKSLTENGTIFEVSTTHFNEDSYRIIPGINK